MRGRSNHRIAQPFGQHEPNGDDSERNDTVSNQVNVLENRLLSERRVLVFSTIDDKLARDVCARLLTLASETSDPIDVFINSPGGHVESGDTIHDMVRFIDSTAPVRMVVHRLGCECGGDDLSRRTQGAALCAAEHAFHAAPAAWWCTRAGHRYRDRGARNREDS